MFRATLGAALALTITGGTVAAAHADRAPARCTGPCAQVVVAGHVDGAVAAGDTFVLADPGVVRARAAARRALRRADAVDVVLRDSTVIVVRDDAGGRADVLPEELLAAVEAGVDMDARVSGRLAGPRRDPSIRAKRVLVDVASLDEVLPVDEPGAEDPVPDEAAPDEPALDDAPADDPGAPPAD